MNRCALAFVLVTGIMLGVKAGVRIALMLFNQYPRKVEVSKLEDGMILLYYVMFWVWAIWVFLNGGY